MARVAGSRVVVWIILSDAGQRRVCVEGRPPLSAPHEGVPPNKRLKLAARRILNDDFFFSAPQLKRDPLGARFMSETVLPTASFKILIGTVVVCAAFVLAYGFLGVPPHPFIQLVVLIAPLVAAISWLQADAKLRQVPLIHDMGFFLWIAWPALIPWYAVKTRGWHALPFGLVIMLTIITPRLIEAIIAVSSKAR